MDEIKLVPTIFVCIQNEKLHYKVIVDVKNL
jgi:hypothetical protein